MLPHPTAPAGTKAVPEYTPAACIAGIERNMWRMLAAMGVLQGLAALLLAHRHPAPTPPTPAPGARVAWQWSDTAE